MTPLSQRLREFFDGSKQFPVAQIPFDNEVRRLCEQNACGNYGRCWTCPPAIDAIDQLQARLSAFDRFYVFYKVYALEDSFDWEGIMRSVRNFQSTIIRLKKDLRRTDPRQKLLILGAGSCQLCDACTYPQQKPCRNPEDALYSVESYGVDAMKLMTENGLKYHNGTNTVTYVGGIFLSP
jgi:predicted metal-binding protein